MKIFSLIFKQTSFQIIGKIVTSFSTFIILSLIARFYGKEDLGSFTLSLTYLGVFMMIADFGFNGHLLRDKQFIMPSRKPRHSGVDELKSLKMFTPQSGVHFREPRLQPWVSIE